MIKTIIDYFLANSPIRGFPGNSVLGTFLIIIIPLLIGIFIKHLFYKNKCLQKNISNLIFAILILILLYFIFLNKFDVYHYYIFFTITFVLSLLYWGYILLIKKDNSIYLKSFLNEKLNEKIEVSRNKSRFQFIYLVIVVTSLAFINILLIGGDFKKVVGADTWWHIASSIRINDVLRFRNPLFNNAINHYPPLSYILPNILSKIGLSITQSFNFLAILFNILNTLLFYLVHIKIIKNKQAALVSALLTSKIIADYTPAVLGYFLLNLSLLVFYKFLLSSKKIIYLFFYLITITLILLTHYEFFIISLVIQFFFLVFYVLLKIKLTKQIIKQLNQLFLYAEKYIYFPNEYIIIILGILISIYLNFVNKEALVLKSELPMNLYNNISILSFFFIIYIPIYLIKEKIIIHHKILFISVLFLSTNTFFYFIRIFNIHHVRFSEYAFSVIAYPIIVNELFKKFSRTINKLSFTIVSILVPYSIISSFYPNYIKASESAYINKIKQTSALGLERIDSEAVVFIEPSDLLIRFFALNYNFKIFAVSLNNNAGSRPLTTIPDLVETFGFFDIKKRLKLTEKFLDTGDVNLLKNSKYKINYLLFSHDYFNKVNKKRLFEINDVSIINQNSFYVLIKITDL